MADPNRAPKSTGHASEFYMACREGDLNQVNRYLKTMTTREVNTIEESNNSTALHAAAYFGHEQIVHRLLEVGASVYTRNGHGFTPEQEARKPEVKQVFEQFKSKK